METVVRTDPDFVPWTSVKSRVSWGALLAGAAVGIALYSVLAILGIAVGLAQWLQDELLELFLEGFCGDSWIGIESPFDESKHEGLIRD